MSILVLLCWGSTVAYAQNFPDDNQGVWIYSEPPSNYHQASNTSNKSSNYAFTQPVELNTRPVVERLLKNKGKIEISYPISSLYTSSSISIQKQKTKSSYQNTSSIPKHSSHSAVAKNNNELKQVINLSNFSKISPIEENSYHHPTQRRRQISEDSSIEIKANPNKYLSSTNMPQVKQEVIAANQTMKVKTEPKTDNVKTNNQPIKILNEEVIKPASNFEYDWGVSINEINKIPYSQKKNNRLNEHESFSSNSYKNNHTKMHIYDNKNNIYKNDNNSKYIREVGNTEDYNNSSMILQYSETSSNPKVSDFGYTNNKIEGFIFHSIDKQNSRSFSKDDLISSDRDTSQISNPNITLDLNKSKPGVIPNGSTGTPDSTLPPKGSLDASSKPGLDPNDPNVKKDGKDEPGKNVDTEGFPIPPLEEGYIRFKAANKVNYDRKMEIMTLEGDVTIYSGEIMIAADKIVVDQKSNTIQAWGYVCVQRYDDIFFADEAFMNYNTGSFRAVGISGNSGGPQINGTLYFKGEELNGTFEKYTISRGEITTCEPYCAPEYSLYARKLIIEPKRKITLINGFTKIYKAKTFYIPYLVMPLEEQYIRRNQVKSDIQQTYGYNDSEGYFGKFAYTYSQRYLQEVSTGLIGAALLDITTRRGFRYGLRQDYYFNKLGVGTIRGEYQSGPALDQKYKNRAEAKNFKIDFSQELQLDSHNQGALSYKKIDDQPDPKRPRTNSENLSFNFANTYKDFSLSSNLAINKQSSGGGTSTSSSKSENLSSGMTLNYQFNPMFNMSAGQSYTSTKNSSYNTPDLEGRSNVQFKWSPRPASVDVSFTRDQDFDGNKYLGDSTASLDRVNPRINVSWKPDAIFGRYKSDVPIKSLSTSFVDSTTGNRNDPRKLQIWELNSAMSRNYKISKDASASFDFGFQQNFYSDMNARFSTSPRASFNFDDRHLFSCNFSWYKTRSFGRISPKAGSSSYNVHSNSISYSANLSDYEVWKINMSSGYNMITRKQDPFSLGLLLDITPALGMNFRGSYDYELQRAGQIEWNTQYYDPHGYFTAELRQTLRPYQTPGAKQSWYDRADLRISGRLHHDLDFNFYTEYQHGRSNAPIRELSFRKSNCCSQLDFGWRATTDSTGEVFVFFTLHAFPTRTAGARIIESDPYFFSPLSELVNPNVYTQGTGITF